MFVNELDDRSKSVRKSFDSFSQSKETCLISIGNGYLAAKKNEFSPSFRKQINNISIFVFFPYVAESNRVLSISTFIFPPSFNFLMTSFIAY